MTDEPNAFDLRELSETRASEVLFRLRLRPYRMTEYVSPSVERLLGYTAAEFTADPGFLREIVVPEDRPRFDGIDVLSLAAERVVDLGLRHREGRTVRVELALWPIREGDRTVAVDGSARDVTRWWHMTSALDRMKRLLGQGFDGTATVDPATRRFVKMDLKAMALLAVESDAQLQKLSLEDFFGAESVERFWTSGALIVSGEMDRSSLQATAKRLDHTERPLVVHLGASDDDPPALMLVFEDLSDERRLAAALGRFESAVAAATDAIVLFDSSHSFIYVNKAFCKLSGHDAWECTGFRPDILRAILSPRELWTAVGDREPWQGLVTGVARGERHVEAMCSVSPVPEPGGEGYSFVAVLHEITGEQAALAALGRERKARAQLTAALATLDESPSVENVAAAMCGAVLALPEVAATALVDATLPAEPRILGIRPEHGFELLPRFLLAPGRLAGLLERAGDTGSVELISSLGSHALADNLGNLGATLLNLAPVHHEGKTIGLLATIGSDGLGEQHNSLADLAAAAAGLLSADLIDGAERRSLRKELQAVLGHRAFRPIFQSIIQLSDGSTVGWEATTRFSDGTSPTQRFAEAVRIGMTVELEIAATRLAVAETAINNPPGWLSLNVTPEFVATGSRLLDQLPGPHRPVVLELASATGLPEAACETLDRLPPHVKVAVDSTSNEMHTLRGVVEIRPAFIKLPVDVVRGIDADRVRQALVAGLQHFAKATSSDLIAVGVETEGELSTLMDLGVSYAQGNYLGPAGFFPKSATGAGEAPVS